MEPISQLRVSFAIWDHTLLPATWHKWTHPALTPASIWFAYPLGVEGWVDVDDWLHTRQISELEALGDSV